MSKQDTYENEALMRSVIVSIRPYVKEDELLIWRGRYRWRNKLGSMALHYKSESIQDICKRFNYELIHDFGHVAVIRR